MDKATELKQKKTKYLFLKYVYYFKNYIIFFDYFLIKSFIQSLKLSEQPSTRCVIGLQALAVS